MGLETEWPGASCVTVGHTPPPDRREVCFFVSNTALLARCRRLTRLPQQWRRRWATSRARAWRRCAGNRGTPALAACRRTLGSRTRGRRAPTAASRCSSSRRCARGTGAMLAVITRCRCCCAKYAARQLPRVAASAPPSTPPPIHFDPTTHILPAHRCTHPRSASARCTCTGATPRHATGVIGRSSRLGGGQCGGHKAGPSAPRRRLQR
jgi:hypothetical protein